MAHDHERHAEIEAARQRDRPKIASPLEPVAGLAARMGNRAFGQAVARMGDGEGILADGTVDPGVQATIAAQRGRGSALPATLAARFGEAFGGPVDDVRVHTDATADALARSVSARAFATGTDVFFAAGEYRPGTPAGDELIAHEVVHTEQQRGAPDAGPLAVSQPGDALEHQADAAARELVD